MAIGCSLATVATAAADDKAKAVVEAPSKAAADPTATVTPPAATAEADTTEAKPDSTERKRGRHAEPRVRIGDDDFESFNEALHTAPWVVGLAFLVAGSILLTPVFLLIGIIWYKLRKTRLQNEAVLQLAERGAIAPAQATDAVMSGVTPEAAVASTAAPLAASSAAPVYQQAVVSRRRAGLVGPAQGRHPVGDWIGLYFLLDGRARLGELGRAGTDVPRHRLHRAVVVRGPAFEAPRDRR